MKIIALRLGHSVLAKQPICGVLQAAGIILDEVKVRTRSQAKIYQAGLSSQASDLFANEAALDMSSGLGRGFQVILVNFLRTLHIRTRYFFLNPFLDRTAVFESF